MRDWTKNMFLSMFEDDVSWTYNMFFPSVYVRELPHSPPQDCQCRLLFSSQQLQSCVERTIFEISVMLRPPLAAISLPSQQQQSASSNPDSPPYKSKKRVVFDSQCSLLPWLSLTSQPYCLHRNTRRDLVHWRWADSRRSWTLLRRVDGANRLWPCLVSTSIWTPSHLWRR